MYPLVQHSYRNGRGVGYTLGASRASLATSAVDTAAGSPQMRDDTRRLQAVWRALRFAINRSPGAMLPPVPIRMLYKRIHRPQQQNARSRQPVFINRKNYVRINIGRRLRLVRLSVHRRSRNRLVDMRPPNLLFVFPAVREKVQNVVLPHELILRKIALRSKSL